MKKFKWANNQLRYYHLEYSVKQNAVGRWNALFNGYIRIKNERLSSGLDDHPTSGNARAACESHLRAELRKMRDEIDEYLEGAE